MMRNETRSLRLGLAAFLVVGNIISVSSCTARTTPAVFAPRLLWTFEAPVPGSVVATPLVTGDAVYLAAIRARGFHLSGAVYALDPAKGKRAWTFDRDGDMLPTAASPILADGKLVIGEGMHSHTVCNLYALDPSTGKPAWSFTTSDHIEGGAALENDMLFVPAGNDGLYAIDARTGDVKWNFRADLHIDTTPALANGRLYLGSGPSRKYRTREVVCLDAARGSVIWRSPSRLPAWGQPVVVGDRVFLGLGNGRLTEPAKSPETPAGALSCYSAANGAELWTFPVADAVFSKPLVLSDAVLFGSRDGNLYCVDFEGRERFRVTFGSPLMAAPEMSDGGVVAVSVGGRMVCVNPTDGREVWRYDLNQSGQEPYVYAAPRVLGRRLYLAAELRTPGAAVGIVTLQCFELPR